MSTELTIKMPSDFVDMSSNELAYDGGINASTIFRDAAIVCGIVAAAGIAITALAGTGACFASGITETMLDGVFKAGVGLMVGGTFAGTAALACWGWTATLETIGK